MKLDRASFLFFTSAIAAAGVGGWVLRDKGVPEMAIQPDSLPLIQTGELTTVAGSIPAAVPPVPICDDSIGNPAPCPAIGPAAEGGCFNIAARRCADFKASFKPRVAENAVACVLALKGAELCDPIRANLCGHASLMLACEARAPIATIDGDPALDSTPPSPVFAACDSIVKGCGNTPLAPSAADCRRSLSGMSDAGRTRMVECMATHCGDRGLIGCEGVMEPRAGQ